MKKINILYLFLLIFSIFSCGEEVNNALLSPAKNTTVKKSGWEYESWSGAEHYTDTVSNQFDSQVLMLSSDTLTAERWFKKIAIKPFATYKVTGYVKTEAVEGENNQSGAGLRLGKFEFTGDTIFRGTTDWTRVEMQFSTELDDSFILELLLGKKGRARGKIYFDNFQLEELSAKELHPKVTLNVDEKLEPMSPYIYGQFIEHMGKSIYGGMWAEMLDDRKFYYVPGTSKSPWQTLADTNSVKIDSSYTYAKGQLPVYQVENKLSLEQQKLALVSGKTYEGRLVFKGKGIEKVTVALDGNKKSFDVSSSNFQKIAFEFSSEETSDIGSLEINFEGNGKLTLAAASLMPADNIKGFRPEVIELMKQLDAPIYRWPGGNFVSGYDWKDGLGDPDKRPTKFERAWNGLEYNDVGIHEFMELCDILKTEANIAVNTGLGDAELAANEVEYFNGDVSTEMGKWRAKNDHPEPYNVKLWAVGNEMFGDWQLGHMPIEDYVKKHNKVAKAMWDVDPDIDLIAVGYPGKWNDMMYKNSAAYMTYISEHFYKQNWHAGGLLTHVNQIPEVIAAVAEEHRSARREIPGLADKNIKIAMDEWNYWYGPHVYGLLGTRYFLRDALGIAAGLNEFSRQSDMYYMANYAQTVNVIGAIKTTKTDAWLEGTGLVLKLYRQEFGTQPIKLNGSPEPLDVSATLTEDGSFLTISVVNATHESQILKLNGISEKIVPSGKSFIISGENDMIYNDEDHKNRIKISEATIEVSENGLAIPKESAGIYKFKLKQ
ncbi:alpha-L-arabinofuranosidase C-terminal domain-containing protein [Zunongwangia endophytica]|uniref:non-reducing end alpha-L-arabinofuranosidase n=1 Tax=Zunongwangia endophytica TaxID=1808945 RepID=A0ABV8HC45_9FLAO|nr:alpha-L-arabinofuranosidase C-terminal domain-containing protein [Zunongwangia endophytica]MDN3594137.1 alpha-L-arabinofuranosidase C-terminal domain-containing protein [Zunongwangia endophytica]